MEGTIDPRWRTSSHSGNGGGNCVEVTDRRSRVLVRDTKDRLGPVLRFSPATWRRFAEQVKRSLARAPSWVPRPVAGALPCPGVAPFGLSGPRGHGPGLCAFLSYGYGGNRRARLLPLPRTSAR
jgi:Domain of unknown function (DUF397)